MVLKKMLAILLVGVSDLHSYYWQFVPHSKIPANKSYCSCKAWIALQGQVPHVL